MGKKDTNVRMSLQTLRVLEAFLEDPTVQLAGAEVSTLRDRIGNLVPDPSSTRICGLVCQPVGIH
jgi:hypothetical protein